MPEKIQDIRSPLLDQDRMTQLKELEAANTNLDQLDTGGGELNPFAKALYAISALGGLASIPIAALAPRSRVPQQLTSLGYILPPLAGAIQRSQQHRETLGQTERLAQQEKDNLNAMRQTLLKGAKGNETLEAFLRVAPQESLIPLFDELFKSPGSLQATGTPFTQPVSEEQSPVNGQGLTQDFVNRSPRGASFLPPFLSDFDTSIQKEIESNDAQVAELQSQIDRTQQGFTNRRLSREQQGQRQQAVQDIGVFPEIQEPEQLKESKTFSPLTSEIVGKTPEGRTIYEAEDGTPSSERTTTFPIGNQWFNYPTIFDGKELSDGEAQEKFLLNRGIDPETGLAVEGYGSRLEAEQAVQARSDAFSTTLPLGSQELESFEVEGRYPEVVPSVPTEDIHEIPSTQTLVPKTVNGVPPRVRRLSPQYVDRFIPEDEDAIAPSIIGRAFQTRQRQKDMDEFFQKARIREVEESISSGFEVQTEMDKALAEAMDVFRKNPNANNGTAILSNPRAREVLSPEFIQQVHDRTALEVDEYLQDQIINDHIAFTENIPSHPYDKRSDYLAIKYLESRFLDMNLLPDTLKSPQEFAKFAFADLIPDANGRTYPERTMQTLYAGFRMNPRTAQAFLPYLSQEVFTSHPLQSQVVAGAFSKLTGERENTLVTEDIEAIWTGSTSFETALLGLQGLSRQYKDVGFAKGAELVDAEIKTLNKLVEQKNRQKVETIDLTPRKETPVHTQVQKEAMKAFYAAEDVRLAAKNLIQIFRKDDTGQEFTDEEWDLIKDDKLKLASVPSWLPRAANFINNQFAAVRNSGQGIDLDVGTPTLLHEGSSNTDVYTALMEAFVAVRARELNPGGRLTDRDIILARKGFGRGFWDSDVGIINNLKRAVRDSEERMRVEVTRFDGRGIVTQYNKEQYQALKEAILRELKASGGVTGPALTNEVGSLLYDLPYRPHKDPKLFLKVVNPDPQTFNRMVATFIDLAVKKKYIKKRGAKVPIGPQKLTIPPPVDEGESGGRWSYSNFLNPNNPLGPPVPFPIE